MRVIDITKGLYEGVIIELSKYPNNSNQIAKSLNTSQANVWSTLIYLEKLNIVKRTKLNIWILIKENLILYLLDLINIEKKKISEIQENKIMPIKKLLKKIEK